MCPLEMLVAFAANRSAETVAESTFIVLLSKNDTHASGRSARFHEVISPEGEVVCDTDSPIDDVHAMSLLGIAEFGLDTVEVEARCLPKLRWAPKMVGSPGHRLLWFTEVRRIVGPDPGLNKTRGEGHAERDPQTFCGAGHGH
jgi:hypothetical protein